ncbi:MAG: hypothetical protein HZRFUVUK_001014 [Candidatus Fervidibacterota bacterium]
MKFKLILMKRGEVQMARKREKKSTPKEDIARPYEFDGGDISEEGKLRESRRENVGEPSWFSFWFDLGELGESGQEEGEIESYDIDWEELVEEGELDEDVVEPYELSWGEIFEMGKAQGGMISLSEIYLPEELVELLGYYYYNWGLRMDEVIKSNEVIRGKFWERIKRKLIRSLLVYKREIPWWLRDEKVEEEEREYLRKLGFNV